MSKAGKALTDVRRWLCDNLSDGDAGMACGMLSVVSRHINELEAENVKLRELCAEMFEAVKCCCGEWCTKTASNCDNNECGWHKCYVALRELGIEAE